MNFPKEAPTSPGHAVRPQTQLFEFRQVAGGQSGRGVLEK